MTPNDIVTVRTVENTGGGLIYHTDRTVRVETVHDSVGVFTGIEVSARRYPLVCPAMGRDLVLAREPKPFNIADVVSLEGNARLSGAPR